jgi:O-antigen ligase
MTPSEVSDAATEHRPLIALIAVAIAFFVVTSALWALFLGQAVILKAIVIASGASVCLLIFMEPLAGVVLFVFLLPTEGLFTYRANFTLAKAVGIIAFASFLCDAQLRRSIVRLDRQGRAILAFTVWLGLSFLWAELKLPVVRWAVTCVQFILLWVLLRASVRTASDLRHLAHAFVAGTVVAVVLSVILPRTGIHRLIYQGWNPNNLARDIVISLILLLYYGGGRRPLAWLTAAGAGGLLMLALVLTQSRTGWLAAIICIPLSISRRRRTFPLVLLAAMAILAVVMFSTEVLSAHLGITSDTIENRWQSIFHARVMRHSRLDVWRAGIILGSHNPVLGIGAGGFLVGVRDVITRHPEFLIVRPEIDAHNSFIRIFAELGLVGLALFAAILWRCARFIARHASSPEKMVAWALFLATMIRMFFSSAYVEKPTWFALFFTQAIVAARAFGAPSSREPNGATE